MEERVGASATSDAGADFAGGTSPAVSRRERALDRLRGASARLTALGEVVELTLDGEPVFVGGPGRPIEDAAPAEPAATLAISGDNLVRLIDGQLDPRSGLLFGQVKVTGSVPAAMRFCDAVSGVERRRFSFDAAALPKPTTDRARARADLERYGYCIVKDALTAAETAALRKRLRDQADGEKAAGVATFDGGPDGPNQRVWSLINKGREFEDLLDNSLIDEFVPDLLGDHAIIFSYSANIAGPGGQPQILHYDQISVQPPIPDVMVGLNIAYFLDDVTEADGGTRLAPCSGQRGMAPDDPFSTEGTIAAEGPAGSALLWDSRVWHGTGANRSDGLRHVILLYFNRHFMRAQENWSLSMRDEVRARLSERKLTMFGYRVTNTMGGVEGPREGAIVSRPANPIGVLGGS